MPPDRAPGSRLREYPWLLALTIAGPLCEAVPLRYYRITAGLAPQVTAPLPFGIYHDLRWIAVYDTSWLTFALQLAGLLVLRSLLTAAIVRAAWPRAVPRPTFGASWRVAFTYTAVAVVALAPWVVLSFAASATSLSWLAFAALPTFLIVTVILSHGGVVPCWAQLPTFRSVMWALATFFELGIASAAIVLGPWWLAWLSAGGAGLFNAWAWRGLVGALATRPRPHRPLPLVPAALALLFAFVLGGVAIRVNWNVDASGGRGPALAAAQHHETAVLVTHGFDSNWKGSDPPIRLAPGYFAVAFSYSGLDRAGNPRPYDAEATHARIAHLVALMDAQVQRLHRWTHRPVRLVAVSEGDFIARSYLAAHPGAPVSTLVMASTLVEPGRVSYPPAGHDGWGFAAGWGMRALGGVFHAITGVHLDPDMGFLRSIVDHAPTLRTGMLCPVPGVRVFVTQPIEGDATIPPIGSPVRVPIEAVAAFHGNDLGDALEIATGGALVPTSHVVELANRLLRADATAWLAPELPLSLNPEWHPPQRDAHGCPLTGWPGQR